MKNLIKNILREEIRILKEKESNPCWDGYEMIGMKDKDGKEVPNCVPIEEEIIQEAEYRGRKVKLNKPMQGDVKKYMQYEWDVNFFDAEIGDVIASYKRRMDNALGKDCPDPESISKGDHKRKFKISE